MKERELYLERIQVNKHITMQVDPDNHDNLLVYQDHDLVEVFSLKRRIHTLFKILQKLTESDEFILLNKDSYLYAKEILITDNLYMKVNDQHTTISVDFYTKNSDGKTKLLYVTKVTYMAQKLFNHMLIPLDMMDDPDYQMKYPKLFKDMIDIVSMIKI